MEKRLIFICPSDVGRTRGARRRPSLGTPTAGGAAAASEAGTRRARRRGRRTGEKDQRRSFLCAPSLHDSERTRFVLWVLTGLPGPPMTTATTRRRRRRRRGRTTKTGRSDATTEVKPSPLTQWNQDGPPLVPVHCIRPCMLLCPYPQSSAAAENVTFDGNKVYEKKHFEPFVFVCFPPCFNVS